MGKRWVAAHNADKRAIELHLLLREIEQMQSIFVIYKDDNKTIIVGDKADRDYFRKMSVDNILSLNVQEAKDKGGTFKALLTSRRPAKPQVSQAEVDEGVQSFLSGDQDQ